MYVALLVYGFRSFLYVSCQLFSVKLKIIATHPQLLYVFLFQQWYAP